MYVVNKFTFFFFQEWPCLLIPAIAFSLINLFFISPFIFTIVKFLLATDDTVNPELMFHMHHVSNFLFCVLQLIFIGMYSIKLKSYKRKKKETISNKLFIFQCSICISLSSNFRFIIK